MDAVPLDDVVRNFNLRFDRIEQFLPTVATREAVSRLATKDELRTESADTRRYMKMLVEDLRSEIRLLAEGLVALDERDARQHTERLRAQSGLESRVSDLEARRRPPRPR